MMQEEKKEEIIKMIIKIIIRNNREIKIIIEIKIKLVKIIIQIKSKLFVFCRFLMSSRVSLLSFIYAGLILLLPSFLLAFRADYYA